MFCLLICLCTVCVPSAQKRPEESDPLEVELKVVLGHHGLLGTKPRSFGGV